MRLKYKFILSSVNGKFCAVTVGDDRDKYKSLLKMNSTSAYIFELLYNDISFDEIVDRLYDKYQCDISILRERTTDFIQILRKENLITE